MKVFRDLYPILLILAILLCWVFLGPETNRRESLAKEWRTALHMHEAEIVCEAPKFPYLQKKQACTISSYDKSDNASSFLLKNEKLN